MQVADGGIIACTHEVVNCAWLLQGHQFATTFKILPLKCYDAILGMDWLEQHSPMQVQWAEKWLSFSHHGKIIKLQGLSDFDGKCSLISEDQLHAMQKQDEVFCIVQLYATKEQKESERLPLEIQAIVSNYADLFAEPSGVPPSRSMNHVMPLLSGTQTF